MSDAPAPASPELVRAFLRRDGREARRRWGAWGTGLRTLPGEGGPERAVARFYFDPATDSAAAAALPPLLPFLPDGAQAPIAIATEVVFAPRPTFEGASRSDG